MEISVIIPVYNEEATIRTLIRKVQEIPIVKQIIIVDDGSSDSSWQILQEFAGIVDLVRHGHNQGKGAAIITALPKVTNEITLIQDADLELDPKDYLQLIAPFSQDNSIQAVFGSRFMNNYSWTLTSIFNGLFSVIVWCLYGVKITDGMIGYKVIRTNIFKSLNLKSMGFGIEPEILGLLLRRRIIPIEVPVSYLPRTKKEGKKMRYLTDCVKVLIVLFKTRFTNI